MSNKDAVIWETWGVAAFTVKHIITEHQKYEDLEKTPYLQYIGETLRPDLQSITNIIQFLKKTLLYNYTILCHIISKCNHSLYINFKSSQTNGLSSRCS